MCKGFCAILIAQPMAWSQSALLVKAILSENTVACVRIGLSAEVTYQCQPASQALHTVSYTDLQTDYIFALDSKHSPIAKDYCSTVDPHKRSRPSSIQKIAGGSTSMDIEIRQGVFPAWHQAVLRDAEKGASD